MDQKLTADDARLALKDHVAARAFEARARYEGGISTETLPQLLQDTSVVRYPTSICYDASPLQPGEFAYAQAVGDHPSEGYILYVHPTYANADVLPQLVAYHIVSINYGDVATAEEAELFGSTLLGIDAEEYYNTLCRCSDALF